MRVLRKLKEVVDSLLKANTNSVNYDENVQILLKAMVNAAKSDGEIDMIEKMRILNFMGDMTEEERAFVEEEMNKPLDVKSFLKEIPKGMEQQVYYMSLYTIDIDEEAEVDYIDLLANELGLDIEVINSIQESLGFSEVAL